jgi:hypothetical protein
MGPRQPQSTPADDPGQLAVLVELVLYVSAGSLACDRALATLRSVLADYPPGRIQLVVRDVAEHVEAAARDRILFTPTLLCGTREPYLRVLGDLTNRAILLDVLETARFGRD